MLELRSITKNQLPFSLLQSKDSRAEPFIINSTNQNNTAIAFKEDSVNQMQPPPPTPPSSIPMFKPPKTDRLAYMDYLRIFLAQSVILYHSFYVVYRGWSPSNPYSLDCVTENVSTAFLQFNQAYFMALFFFISGFFITKNYNKKGPLKFMIFQSIRLLCPVFRWVSIVGPTISLVIQNSYQLQPIDHLWFTLLLCIFHITYIIFRLVPKFNALLNQPLDDMIPPHFSNKQFLIILLKVWAITTTMTFLVRLCLPTNGYMTSFLGEAAYMPQYIIAFFLGDRASRSKAIERIHVTAGAACLFVGIVVFSACETVKLALFPDQAWTLGGISATQFLITCYEMLFAMLFSVGLLVLFRNFFDQSMGVFFTRMTKATFSLHVIHPVFVVLFYYEFSLIWNNGNALLLILTVTALGTIASWTASLILKSIPKPKLT